MVHIAIDRQQLLNDMQDEKVSPHLPRMKLSPVRDVAAETLNRLPFDKQVAMCTDPKVAPGQRDANFKKLAGGLADNLEQQLGSGCAVQGVSAASGLLKFTVNVQTHEVED